MFYDRPNFYGDATMGFDWGGLLNTGIQTGVGLGIGWLQSSQQPSGGRQCLQGQVRGDEAMENCIPRVMALFDELETQIAYGAISAPDAVNAANQIAGIFSDNLYFDQSIGGRSRTLREEAKVTARARADAIIAAVNQQLAAQQAIADPVASQSGGMTIDTQTVLVFGGGALLLILLMK